ncbi:GGDEF domain-containing protein [Romboutsia lituseburensis]|uniref:GGDEF domain-containing protein n=1 Tax=Romboutsia lituseburensis TaxID=1537 RepID=UPI00215B2303|nr:GGDEF domain-containing protein [Romboutsia lituseburensis]MCR8746851.1 GGDEF domain-containing protein [Romboutsia lituseburensis]
MKNKTLKIIFILLMISVLFYKMYYIYNVNHEIHNIKRHHQLRSYEKKDFKLNNKTLIYSLSKNNKNIEANFILGYYSIVNGDIDSANKYFDLATKQINNTDNKFIKYYIYNKLSYKFIDSDYDKAKQYTKLALENIDLKNDNKGYILVWNSLFKYVNKTDGVYFIIENMEKYLLRSDKNNIFGLTKNIAPMYYIAGNREKTIKSFLYILHSANERQDMYLKSKTLIDLSSTFSDVGAFDLAQSLVYKSFKSINKIDDNRKYNMDLYAYTALCGINLNKKDTKNLKKYINKIYELEGKIPQEEYNDYLINAKVFESMTNDKSNGYKKSKQLIDEAIKILENEKEVLLVDTDILVISGYAHCKYLIGKYQESIKYYEIAYKKMNERKSRCYEVLILTNLKELYHTVGNTEKFNQTKESLENIYSKYQNEIAASYLKNSISEYKELIKVEEDFKHKIGKLGVIIFVLIAFIITVVSYNIKNKKLEAALKIDPLTKIYNRGYFNLMYDTLLKGDGNKGFYIAMLDIDDFKHINDTYGHQFGDEVLVGICKFFRKNLNNNCSVYRYGGEEFVIIIKNKTKKEVLDKCERYRKSIESMTWGENITVTVSIGVAGFKENEYNTLGKADENLYISKLNGKNKVSI